MAVVAVEGADWRVVDELVAAGRLPAFARLKKGGAHGLLKAEPPLLSPVVWTTVATGRPPEDHGVLDSMVDVGGGSQVPVHGGARHVKAAWQIWSEASRSVLIAGWPATWPADRVRGVVASDRLAAARRAADAPSPPDRRLVHPPEALESIARHVVAPSSLDAGLLARFGPLAADSDAAVRLRGAVAAARSWRAVTVNTLEAGQPDLVAVHFGLVDTVSHLFVRDRSKGEGAIAAAYEEVDGALAEIGARLHPATLVVVVSGHGFHAPDAGVRDDPSGALPAAAAWHRPYGVFAAVDAGIITGARDATRSSSVGIVSLLDILPTLLARAGLPVAADMPGRVLPELAPPGPHARVASYGLPEAPQSAAAAADKVEGERLPALAGPPPPANPTPLARVHLAGVLHRRGDYRAAIRELETALRQDALDGLVSLWLARCHAALGRADEALRIYDRVLRGRAGVEAQATALLEATALDLRAGRVSAALERVDRAPAALDRAPEALIARGDASEAEGKRRDAERFYQAALNTAPSDATAARRLVELLIAHNQADTGRMLAARLAQAYPSSPHHLALAGRASLAIGRHVEAARWFELALALAPDDPELQSLLEDARKR